MTKGKQKRLQNVVCCGVDTPGIASGAPYCHTRKIAIEEDHPVIVTVIDRREVKQIIDVQPNGYANGHGRNGSDTV